MTEYTRPLFVFGSIMAPDHFSGEQLVPDEMIERIRWDPKLSEIIDGAKKISPNIKFIYKIEMRKSPSLWHNSSKIDCSVIHIKFNSLEEAVQFDLTYTFEIFEEIFIG